MRESSIFLTVQPLSRYSITVSNIYLSINLYAYVMNICTRMCIHVYDAANKIILTYDIHIGMHTYMYIYICIFIHLYIYIYVYIYYLLYIIELLCRFRFGRVIHYFFLSFFASRSHNRTHVFYDY